MYAVCPLRSVYYWTLIRRSFLYPAILEKRLFLDSSCSRDVDAVVDNTGEEVRSALVHELHLYVCNVNAVCRIAVCVWIT